MAVEISWAGVVTGGFAVIAGAYLTRRGQNLADRHDLARLTQLAEEIRSAVRVSEEHVRNILAKDASTHVKRFEVELPIYQDLWNKVIDLDDALSHVRVANGAGVTTGRRTPAQAYAAFRECLATLQNTARRLEPFFAPEVSRALLIATLPLRRIAAQPEISAQATKAERDSKLEVESKEIVNALHGLREAIRTRLLADAIAVKTLPTAQAAEVQVIVRDDA
jgi:hypothetical protein